MSKTAAARTDGVWKVFQQEAESVEAVRDVSLTIERGEFTALAGPSGSGKTTLLNLIGGLTSPTKGRVWVAGARGEPHVDPGFGAATARGGWLRLSGL